MQLIERDAVLTALTEYAGEARAGDGRVVLVAGEAGVGKTALLEVLRERVPDARWLWGACEGSFTPRPLGPLYDVADQVGGSLATACNDDASRQHLFRALLDELTSFDELTVLCLEDMHWADDASLDLLRYLAPRLRQARTMLVATYRDDGLAPDHPLRMTVGELGTERSTRRVDLPPLSQQAVARLAQAAGIAGDELFALTGGNPFLVTEVIEGGSALPPSAREAVLARVARLSTDARKTLEAAAVIGNRVEVDLLRAAANGSADAIDECLTAGALLSEQDGFRFRHEIARRAVEEALPAHRSAELHGRVLDLLVATGSTDDARLAHHAEAAGAATAVVEFARRAGERASGLGAHREAAAQYERALRVVRDADPRTRADLLVAAGAEHALTDHWHDALVAQLEALALWEKVGDRLRYGDTLRHVARTKWRLCLGAESLQAAEESVAVLEELPVGCELGWAYSFLGAFVSSTEPARATACLDQARAIAEQFADVSLLATVHNSVGCMKANDGEDGFTDLKKALDLAMSVDDDEQVGRALANLQAIQAEDYLLAEASQTFRDGMAYCADHDIGTYTHCLRGVEGAVLDRTGRWDEAEELLIFDLEERALSPINKISKLAVVGIIAARRGKASSAGVLDEMLALSELSLQSTYVFSAGLNRLEAAWLAGDAEAARREAKRASDNTDDGNWWTRGALAAWLRRCGLPEVAVGSVAPPYALQLAGDWRAAADAWRVLGCPYDEALALLDSGDRDAMHEAVRIFERLGATATVARAQATMRQLGFVSIPRGRRADTRANRFGLTRREQEVLALLTEGLTNADIASRLFIAEKTVDNHVSSVLAKMNVESRRDAARLVSAT